jgi:mannose-1-phosphate guanylyltransferase
MIVPVILSGGEGRRLWPLSSPTRPKQFLTLAGEETLLQQTVRRLSDPSMFAPPIIIGGAEQRFLIAEQLRAGGLAASRIVVEPMGRNTGPALAVGAVLAVATDPEALILSAHADHSIPDPAAFRETVALGVPAAEAGRLVLFGIKPTFAATGYGYIEPGLAIDRAAREVVRFAAARAAIAAGESDADFLRLDAVEFGQAPSISIDHAVMERTSNAAVAAAAFAWSDIGSWSSVWEAQSHDENGNAVRGAVVLEEARDCLVFAEGPKIAAYGVSDLIIVATADRVLVAPRLDDQRVRDLAEKADKL